MIPGLQNVLSTLTVNNLCTLGTTLRRVNSEILPDTQMRGKTPTLALTFVCSHPAINWHNRLAAELANA